MTGTGTESVTGIKIGTATAIETAGGTGTGTAIALRETRRSEGAAATGTRINAEVEAGVTAGDGSPKTGMEP